MAVLAAVVLLTACAGGDGDSGTGSGILATVFGGGEEKAATRSRLIESDLVFFGVVAGDEPVAVRAAEEVLKYGGSAADAAVALALTLGVTMPSMASLGGGGVCIVHDPGRPETEIIDFIAPPGSSVAGADRPSAIPTMLRGVTALHARYGQQDIRTLLASAEKLARFGFVVSRASARDFQLAAQPLFNDPAARDVFARRGGAAPAEGDTLVQADLAETFSSLRTNGVSSFYKGPMAEKIVEGVTAAGGTLTLDDLAGYLPAWRKAVLVPYRDQVLAFAPPPAGVGVGGALMWHMLASDDRYRNATEDGRAHLLVEAAKRAFAARDRWIYAAPGSLPTESYADAAIAAKLMAGFDPQRATPASAVRSNQAAAAENPSGTGFVVVDLVGQAVACTLTNYNFFGTGRVAPGTGMLVAAAPGEGDRNALSLGPVAVFEQGFRSFRLALAGAGGAATTTATMTVLAESLLGEFPLERAMQKPRVHHGGLPDVVLAEEAVPRGVVAALRAKGNEVVTVPSLGRMNAAECPLGLDSTIEEIACFVNTDPRGFGLAAEAER
ncbi:MAG: gamma-glutamyltransferase [Alphaproteobacteria bacterium]